MKSFLQYIPMTKNMRDDLEFYIKHDSKLYFKGMATIAVAWIGILVAGAYIIFSNTDIWIYETGDPTTGIVVYGGEPAWYAGLTMMLFGALGFGIVKMYLHVRKDAIEIKEMLNERI